MSKIDPSIKPKTKWIEELNTPPSSPTIIRIPTPVPRENKFEKLI